MNPALLALRKKFKGQTAGVPKSAFDNSPWPEGTHIVKVVDSQIKTTDRTDRKTQQKYTCTVHSIMIQGLEGDVKGRNHWPFAPDLGELDGIVTAARNIQAILGDVVPGHTDANDEFQVKVDEFLEALEGLAHRCIGEVIEVRVRNSKTTRDDGTAFQNVYINRGLGEDGKAYLKRSGSGSPRRESSTRHKEDDDLNFGGKKRPARTSTKKKVAKRKVAKRKKS